MKKQTKFEWLTQSQINAKDDLYQHRTNEDIDSLQTSIGRIGLVNPIIVQKAGPDSFRIVCGFKRYTAIRAFGIDSFPAQVIEESGSNLDLFLMAIQENQMIKSLNPIELSTILRKLQTEFEIEKSDIVESYLPILGYGQNPRVLQLYDRLEQLPKEWQSALIADRLSLDVAGDILGKFIDYSEKIWQLFDTLRLGKNRQREFLGLLDEVAQIKSITISQLYDMQSVQEILNEPKLTPPQKSERLKGWLWQNRYPRYSQAKAEYEDILRQAHLPGNVRIQSPPYFEGDSYSVEFSFSTEQDFEKTVSALQKIKAGGIIKKLAGLL